MPTQLTVVVAGARDLADALSSTGQFAAVLAVESTSGIRDLLSSGRLSRAANDKVFIFADCTRVDTEQTLQFLITRLAGMGTPTIVVATSPGGRDLVRQCPGAGLLEGPLMLNQVLGALSGHRGLPTLTPAANNIAISLPGLPAPTPVAAPAKTAFPAPLAPANPTPAPAPADVPVPAAVGANPFASAPSAAATSRPGISGGFAAHASAPAAVAEDAATPAQAAPNLPVGPATSVTANPFGAASSPFGQPAPAAEPAAAVASVGNPFGAPQMAPSGPFGASSAAPGPFVAPAPAEPTSAPQAPETTMSPFGTPAGAAPSPFDPAPAASSPFAAAGPGAAVSPSPVPAAAPVAANPFGAAAPAPAAGPFGGAPAAGSGFGAPSAPAGFQGPSPFGQGASPFAAAAEPSGVAAGASFGADFGQGAGSFGGGPAARPGVQVAERPVRRGHVVTVTAPKGGTGKSTMTLNMAAYLGLRLRGTGRNVCVIDANVQQADTGTYLGRFTPNVENVLKDPSSIHPDRINDHLIHMPNLNLSALLGPSTPEVANPLYFSGKRYSQILDALKPNYDYIFIDTPVAELYHDMFRDFALPRADYLCLVATPNVTTLINTDAWLRQVTAPVNRDGMGVDPQRVGIVLNRAEDDIGLDLDEVRRELGAWRVIGAVPETKEWRRCNNKGQLVATKNYTELNEAFSQVLESATGEDLVVHGTALPATKQRGGILAKLKRKGH